MQSIYRTFERNRELLFPNGIYLFVTFPLDACCSFQLFYLNFKELSLVTVKYTAKTAFSLTIVLFGFWFLQLFFFLNEYTT